MVSKKNVLVSVVFMFLAGCVNVGVIKSISVNDAKMNEPINAVSAGCKGLGITRDCDDIIGANRLIIIEKNKIRVASNNQGTSILVMYDNDECGLGKAVCQTLASNRNYWLIKNVLERNNVTINEVKAMAINDFIVGYALTLNKDGYSHLK
jgi:hypothetical protein